MLVGRNHRETAPMVSFYVPHVERLRRGMGTAGHTSPGIPLRERKAGRGEGHTMVSAFIWPSVIVKPPQA
jgi:hypothetical protein